MLDDGNEKYDSEHVGAPSLRKSNISCFRRSDCNMNELSKANQRKPTCLSEDDSGALVWNDIISRESKRQVKNASFKIALTLTVAHRQNTRTSFPRKFLSYHVLQASYQLLSGSLPPLLISFPLNATFVRNI